MFACPPSISTVHSSSCRPLCIGLPARAAQHYTSSERALGMFRHFRTLFDLSAVYLDAWFSISVLSAWSVGGRHANAARGSHSSRHRFALRFTQVIAEYKRYNYAAIHRESFYRPRSSTLLLLSISQTLQLICLCSLSSSVCFPKFKFWRLSPLPPW